MEVLIDMWKLRRAHTDMGGAGMDECHCLIRASALHHHLRIETVRSRRAYISTYPPIHRPIHLDCAACLGCAILFANAQSCSPVASYACHPSRQLCHWLASPAMQHRSTPHLTFSQPLTGLTRSAHRLCYSVAGETRFRVVNHPCHGLENRQRRGSA